MRSPFRLHTILVPVLAVLAATSLPLLAQSPGAACDSEHAHDFDFWIGSWDVHAQGKKAGTNVIEPLMDGCVLQEHWTGASGGGGTSLNFYNPRRKRWQQFWVWKNGTTLELEGGLVEGRMVLEGDAPAPGGGSARNRITWTPNPDGSVRQLWEVSPDGGKTWKAVFDGLYRRRGD